MSPITIKRAFLLGGVFRHNERTTLRSRGNFLDFSGKCIGRGQKTCFRAWRTHLLNSMESVHTKLIGAQGLFYRSRPHSGQNKTFAKLQSEVRSQSLPPFFCHLSSVVWQYSAARRPQRLRAAYSFRRHLQTAKSGLLSAEQPLPPRY